MSWDVMIFNLGTTSRSRLAALGKSTGPTAIRPRRSFGIGVTPN